MEQLKELGKGLLSGLGYVGQMILGVFSAAISIVTGVGAVIGGGAGLIIGAGIGLGVLAAGGAAMLTLSPAVALASTAIGGAIGSVLGYAVDKALEINRPVKSATSGVVVGAFLAAAATGIVTFDPEKAADLISVEIKTSPSTEEICSNARLSESFQAAHNALEGSNITVSQFSLEQDGKSYTCNWDSPAP